MTGSKLKPFSLTDHMSTEYIVAFPDIHELPDKVQLYIVSRESSFSGYVSSPYLGAFRNFTTTSGTVTVNLPIGIELPIGRSKNKVLYVKASKPVSVFGLTHNKLKVGEGFAVYPIHALGKYYTASTVPPKGGYYAFIAVIGTANQTSVQITLNTTKSVTVNGRSYSDGDTVQVALDRMEAMQIEYSGEFSGSTIMSNKPVAVMTGNTCSWVLTSHCTHMVEFLPPTTQCGSKYVIPPFQGAQKILRMFASVDYTNVNIQGKSFNINRTITTKALLQVPLNANKAYTIIADNRVCVYLIWLDWGSVNSAPMLTFVPSIDQYVNDAVFPKPTIQSYNHYVSGAIKSSSLPNLRIGNHTISNASVEKIMLEGTEYSTFWYLLPKNTSPYHMWSTSPYDTFGALSYGSKYDESYGYPAGVNFQTT